MYAFNAYNLTELELLYKSISVPSLNYVLLQNRSLT